MEKKKRGFTLPTQPAPKGFEIVPVDFSVTGKGGEQLQGWGLAIQEGHLRDAIETVGEEAITSMVNASQSKHVYTQSICRALWGKGVTDGDELVKRVFNWMRSQRNVATPVVVEKIVQVYRLPDGSTTTDEKVNDLAWEQHMLVKMAEKRAK